MRRAHPREEHTREARLERWLEWPMLALAVAVVPIIALPELYALTPAQEYWLAWANLVIWAAFYLELFLKLLVSNAVGRTLRRNWFLLIILLSPALSAFRLVGLARLFSLVRLLRLHGVVYRLKPQLARLIYTLEYVVLAFALFVLVSAFLIWQIESQQGGAIRDFGDALWWSVITVTTIGYGDVIPATSMGKIFGALIALFGILLFMVLVARLTAFFVRSGEIKEVERHLDQIERKLK